MNEKQTNNNSGGRSIPERSVDSIVLYNRIRTMEEGDVVPYSELSDLIKCNVQKSGYCYMQTARRIAQREDEMVFEAVLNVGLRRVSNDKIADVSRDNMKRARRSVRKGARILACAKYERLDDAGRKEHNTMSCMLGALELATKPKNVRKVEAEVNRSGMIAIGNVFSLFRDKDE